MATLRGCLMEQSEQEAREIIDRALEPPDEPYGDGGEQTITAVLIRTDSTVREIDGDYDSIRSALDGWLEIAPTPGSPFVMYCDEEGKIKGKPVNVRANTLANRYRDWNDPIAGDVVLVGPPTREGEDTSFTLAELLDAER